MQASQSNEPATTPLWPWALFLIALIFGIVFFFAYTPR
jgi:hypothetical protein